MGEGGEGGDCGKGGMGAGEGMVGMVACYHHSLSLSVEFDLLSVWGFFWSLFTCFTGLYMATQRRNTQYFL